jgi:hypothetical protein
MSSIKGLYSGSFSNPIKKSLLIDSVSNIYKSAHSDDIIDHHDIIDKNASIKQLYSNHINISSNGNVEFIYYREKDHLLQKKPKTLYPKYMKK